LEDRRSPTDDYLSLQGQSSNSINILATTRKGRKLHIYPRS
jgi:hypothetical protein